ncbi:MAG: tetratricopeptide repeat protein [Prevotella sp.]|nr:tetratricopeptide repeat protein [Prevotella sp.]
MKRIIFLALIFATSIITFGKDTVKRPDTYNYNRGIEELRNGNYKDALDYLNKEIESDPNNGYAYSWMAMIYQSFNENGMALTTADLALKNIPKKDGEFIAATYCIRAAVYLALKDTVKAVNDFTSAIKANPTYENAYEKRAQVYFEQEKYDLADADYRQMIKLNQGGAMGYMGIGRNRNEQKRWDEAIEQFNHVANMYNDYSLVYSYRAQSYLGEEKWTEATDDILQALLIDDNDRAFAQIQDLDEPAFSMMEAKMKIQSAKNPNESRWPYYIAIMYECKEQYEKAISYYEEAQRKDAKDYTLNRIANCYYEEGNYDRALKYVNQAMALDSTENNYIAFKAEILYGMGKVKDAIAEYDKYLALNPEDGFRYYRRGWFKDICGDDDGAIEDLTISITLYPTYSYTYAARGDVYTRLGKTELAKADYEKVIELEDTPEKYECLHYAYHALGEDEKAIAAIDTILARDKNNKGNYYDAACLYSRMKNKEKALEYLGMCLEKGYWRFEHIKLDSDMDFIRETDEFKALIEKYESRLKEKNAVVIGNDTISKQVTTEVPFTKENGVCHVKCKINDLPLYFVFDTGASEISLSMVEATFMMKNGYLDKKDVIGSQYFEDANGNVSEGTIINIRQVDFGGLKLENVRASVVRNQKAPLLLGQSVLGRLGKIEIDNDKLVLKITHNINE